MKISSRIWQHIGLSGSSHDFVGLQMFATTVPVVTAATHQASSAPRIALFFQRIVTGPTRDGCSRASANQHTDTGPQSCTSGSLDDARRLALPAIVHQWQSRPLLPVSARYTQHGSRGTRTGVHCTQYTVY